MRQPLIFLVSFLLICCASNDEDRTTQSEVNVETTSTIGRGSGSFTYFPPGPLSNKPVIVFYHIPEGDLQTMPILFSFHGANRNAADYRDYWQTAANQHLTMVFAPKFSSAFYPGLGDDYLMGSVFVDGDNPTANTRNQEAEWTFSVIEPLFDYIKTEISGQQATYNAWGHSGGAQFLHRFLFFKPNNRVSKAVCANAGWYTIPQNEVTFPCGIAQSGITNEQLMAAFEKELIIHLGENDNDPNASNLRRNQTVDDQQGVHRLARGNYFFATCQNKATALNSPFEWEKILVPNTAHEAQAMASEAVQYLMQE